MQGFGCIAGFPEIQDERIFNYATGRREVAREPLHHWVEHAMPDGIGLGLAMPFAWELLKTDSCQHIGFVPAARGGSSLAEWMPGNEHFARAVHLLERARKSDPSMALAGLLWHQGEADSTSLETARTYGDRLLTVFEGFRAWSGDSQLPIVAGELGRFLAFNPHYSAYETVVAQTREAIASLACAAFATSENLTCDGGHTHFDSHSIRRLGFRYAACYREIMQRDASSRQA